MPTVFEPIEAEGPSPEPATPAEPPALRSAVALDPAGQVIAGLDPAPGPPRAGFSNAEWPSARAIFAAQGPRALGRESGPPVAARAGKAGPSPTDPQAPACWSIPAWLGTIPAAAVALVVGVGGLALACEWTVDETSADLAMTIALGTPSPSIDPLSLPRGGWWRSTAPHLAAGAMALARAEDGEDHSEEVRTLTEAARHASPLSSTTRFAIEPVTAAEGGATADLAYLGRSRDVVTLAWTGRRLRQAGKIEASLRAFRSALEIAGRARPDEIEPPGFDEDRQVSRYRLPRESLIGPVIAEMDRAGEWSHEQWVEVLPGSATAPLVASRVLRKARKPAQADRLVDLAIARADVPTSPGLDLAEHLAAVAEGLATRSRWTDAAEQYRRAIDRASDDPTRRRWWLNLADIAKRIGDDATRTRAIEAAKAPDSADEISKRALRHQQANPGLAARGDRP